MKKLLILLGDHLDADKVIVSLDDLLNAGVFDHHFLVMAVALSWRPCFYCLAHNNVDFHAFLLFLREIKHLTILDEKTDVFLVLSLVPVVMILVCVGFPLVVATYSLRYFLYLLLSLVTLRQLDRSFNRSLCALLFVGDLAVEIHGFNFSSDFNYYNKHIVFFRGVLGNNWLLPLNTLFCKWLLMYGQFSLTIA